MEAPNSHILNIILLLFFDWKINQTLTPSHGTPFWLIVGGSNVPALEQANANDVVGLMSRASLHASFTGCCDDVMLNAKSPAAFPTSM